ncbi:hypothetical protein J3A83DRAFT_4376763 [Scleroderma citrinum]
MLNTSLLTGSYILSANSGPVDTCHVNGQTRVVVLHPHVGLLVLWISTVSVAKVTMRHQEVYFERLYDDIYVIRFGNENGTVQTTPDYRLVVQPGEQRWIIRQYDHESNVYTIVEAENPSLAWTDPGGPPGCNHWATYIYRSGHIVKHHIITLPGLLPACFSGGNYTDHCTLITDPNPTSTISACEDIAFWDHLDVECPLWDPAPRGYLWLFDTNIQALQPVRLEGYPVQHDFHPLGLEAEPSRAGNPSALFIINHAREQTTIEQFVLDPV